MALSSLHISGYRGFKNLTIPHLAPTNLIVGKNSVGKTSLLEALLLYCQRGHPRALLYPLEYRQESLPKHLRGLLTSDTSRYDLLTESHNLNNLFYGRPDFTLKEEISFQINQQDETGLKVSIGSFREVSNSQPELGIKIVFEGVGDINKLASLFTQPTTFISYSQELQSSQKLIYIPVAGITSGDAVSYWNAISLTPLEDKITEALNFVVSGGISRFNFIDTQAGQVPKPIVVYNNSRMALESLGDGLKRMLGLALALANAENGIFIVDEIGSGLHYTVQTKMWEFLMTLAHELNVQIFATTHSSDCVKAFQYVSNKLTDIEGQLIRLEKWEDEVTAVLVNEEQMQFALEEAIEVR